MGQSLRDRSALTLWKVEKLVPGGAGFCRLSDGTVAFVEGALPGESVKPLGVERKRDFSRATSFELVQASPERVAAPCPVVDACGGCDWMKLERAAELRYKAGIVAEALERTGGVKLTAAPEMVTAGDELRYRSRVRLHVERDGRVGFFARGTKSLVEVPGCLVAEPDVERGMRLVHSVAEASKSSMAKFEAVEVRGLGRGELEFLLVPRHGRSPDAEGVRALLAKLAAHGRVSVSNAGGDFSQVNRAVNARLVERVVAGALERRAATFLDLYAGAGNFALPLARAGLTGVAIENDGRAVRRGRELAARDASKLDFRERDVPRALIELSREGATFDLVLLDPPRSGAKQALSGVVSLAPRVVGYVACDPVTLARDLRELAEAGYFLASVTCFDMFPKTHHVETLVWLEAARLPITAPSTPVGDRREQPPR